MDQTEQQYIDSLFDRLGDAERQSGPRDVGAERYIQQLISRQYNAPYYMAQTLIMQDEALKAAQQRIEDLERELEERPQQQSGGGSFLGGLFGGGGATRGTSVPSSGSVPRAGGGFSYPREDRGPMMDSPPVRYGQTGGGGGFLAGAMQTAAGVAGGVLLGNVLGDMFKGHGTTGTAQASESGKSGDAHKSDDAGKTDASGADKDQQNDPFSHVEETKYDDDDTYIGGDDFGGGDDGYDI